MKKKALLAMMAAMALALGMTACTNMAPDPDATSQTGETVTQESTQETSSTEESTEVVEQKTDQELADEVAALIDAI